MDKKRIAVFLGHPRANSFCAALADRYVEAAKATGHEVRFFKVGEMSFDALANPADKSAPTEPDLAAAHEALTWAEHLVFVYPTWWYNCPALFKGFIDRLLRSGLAFKYRSDSPLPLQLLKGRTARLLVTADGPWFYYLIMCGNPAIKFLKMSLHFCGVRPVRASMFSPMISSNDEKRRRWLDEAANLGRKGN